MTHPETMLKQVPLEKKDITILENKFGRSVLQCVIKSLLFPVGCAVFLLIIVLGLVIFTVFSGRGVDAGEMAAFSLMLSVITIGVLWPINLYHALRDFLHMKKVIRAGKKWRLVGPVARIETAVSAGEYGQDDPIMTFETEQGEMSFKLLDADHAERGGEYQVEFVEGREWRVELGVREK